MISGRQLDMRPLQLRRTPHVKTIQASLAIEGNSLTFDQVTDVVAGKMVLGPAKDILEVKNAVSVYEKLGSFNPLSCEDLLKAHGILMKGLLDENGMWRCGNVGVFKGTAVSHIAPQSKRVPELMNDLFQFLAKNHDISWLLKACIFHYEFEFIHPFADGNGRIGRLWQQLILMKEDSIFEFVPVEVLIKEHQEDYYRVLGESDACGESTPFIEFSLDVIQRALEDYTGDLKFQPQDAASRLNTAHEKFSENWFSRKDYLDLHSRISTATASRDLAYGLHENILMRKGDKNQTHYQFLGNTN